MVYYASNSVAPALTAGGPQAYSQPLYKTSCGCGTGTNETTILPARRQENFTAEYLNGGNGNGNGAPAPAQALQAGGGPLCTLTATAPPAGCCNPAPLHCDCCNGSGYFRA